jgi:hypothetical protein
VSMDTGTEDLIGDILTDGGTIRSISQLSPEHTNAVIAALRETGIRATFGYGGSGTSTSSVWRRRS